MIHKLECRAVVQNTEIKKTPLNLWCSNLTLGIKVSVIILCTGKAKMIGVIADQGVCLNIDDEAGVKISTKLTFSSSFQTNLVYA